MDMPADCNGGSEAVGNQGAVIQKFLPQRGESLIPWWKGLHDL